MTEFNKRVEEIIRKGLNKAISRLERVSNINWAISSIKIGPFKPQDEESICVYLKIKSDWDLSAILAVSEKDAEIILKSFISKPLPQFNTLEITEFFTNELGNIILNSFISEFANELGVKIIPYPPKTIKGRESFILENIFIMIEKPQDHTVISTKITLTVKNDITINIYYLISKDLIERIV